MIRTGLALLRLRAAGDEPFLNMRTGRTPPPPARNRGAHAASLLSQLDTVSESVEQSAPLADRPGAAVTASGSGLEDVVSSLGDRPSGVRVLDVRGDTAVLRVSEDLRALRRKVEQYATQETRSGKPKNEPLVTRLDVLRRTTLDDLSGGEIHDEWVNPDALYWVEVWTPAEPELPDDEVEAIEQAVAIFARMAESPGVTPVFYGPDRNIHLIRVPGHLLVQLPELLPDAAEVHLAARIRLVETAERADDEATEVAVVPPHDDAPVVAVHDTGIAAEHPYLAPILLGAGSAVPESGPEDRDGHGTSMSGLVAFGDLAAGVTAHRVEAVMWLVSVRLLETNRDQGGDPDRGALWAERTRLAVEEAETLADGRMTVHNLSIGAAHPFPPDRTAWSVAIDSLAWNGGSGRLFVVAAGNAEHITDAADYPAVNLGTPHDDPAQAWNALTVGAFTDLTTLTAEEIRLGVGAPLAHAGQLSPYSATAVGGRWQGKPEIVMEGGNTAPSGGLANAGGAGLSLLTTGLPHGPAGRLLARAWATSAAAAGGSHALGLVAAAHPTLRPATARALLTHTARWPAVAEAQMPDRRDLLRSFGYGVPHLPHALAAASNRPLMVFEGALFPSRRDAAGRADRRAVFVEIPLPHDELDELSDSDVELAVTLAYFVEPTASRARRAYAGARLRWDMQGPTETPESFRSRINRVVREQGVEQGDGSFPWTIGPDSRSRGTVQHDRTVVPASAVAGTRLVAVYPVLGWWEGAPGGEARELPFSLVVGVDLGDVDIDIHALVETSLEIIVDATG